MPDGMSDLAFSLRLRNIIQTIVKETLDTVRPKYRYAIVVSIDRVLAKCTIIYNGETNEVIVNMGSVQPNAVGQYVRIEGIGTDKFIADVLGPAFQDTDPVTPVGVAEYIHTQSVASATWVINHNLNKFPFTLILVGGLPVLADVTYGSVNQATITFPAATTGTAHLI